MKLISRIAENLPEMPAYVKQKWIENPKDLQKALREALWPPVKYESFKLWKTIEVGTGLKTADEFRDALQKANCRVESDVLHEVIFEVSEIKQSIDLVSATVKDLGFKRGANYPEIRMRIMELGYELCLNEIGPQLCLQYKDQSENEAVFIAMDPINKYGNLCVFGVETDIMGKNRRLMVLSGFAGPDIPKEYLWRSADRFVFMRTK